MAEKAISKRGSQEEDDLMQLVGFTLGAEMFGVDILMVQEIIRSAPITPVPNSPDFVDGVINLRGGIIPVVDLRQRLNITTGEEELNKDWIVILEIEGRTTGFIVDSVTEVLKINADDIEPTPEIIGAGLESQYIQGVCEVDGSLMVLLDFQRILQMDEIKRLESIGVESIEDISEA